MIDRRILQEAETLAEAGYDVTVLSGFECREPDAYEARGVRVKRYVYDWADRRRARLQAHLGKILGTAAWPAWRLYGRLTGAPSAMDAFVLEKALQHSFDVVHVHDFPMLRPGADAAALRGAKLVYDSHEFYPIQASFTASIRRRYLVQERELVRRCDQIITVNPYIARMIADAHAIPAPQVILNAQRPARETASGMPEQVRQERRRRHGLPGEGLLFVYQGWISPERNLEAMVEGAAALPPGAHLAVIGYGDHLTVLREIAARSGAQDRVTFLGRIEADELPAVTALCDVGIVPYRAVDEMHRYCSPNKLFEYIAAQVPVLASDLPYLRDVVGSYRIGWLAELETPADFASAFNRVCADRDGFEAAMRELPGTARLLNWSVEGAKLIDIYSRLVGCTSRISSALSA